MNNIHDNRIYTQKELDDAIINAKLDALNNAHIAAGKILKNTEEYASISIELIKMKDELLDSIHERRIHEHTR